MAESAVTLASRGPTTSSTARYARNTYQGGGRWWWVVVPRGSGSRVRSTFGNEVANAREYRSEQVGASATSPLSTPSCHPLSKDLQLASGRCNWVSRHHLWASEPPMTHMQCAVTVVGQDQERVW